MTTFNLSLDHYLNRVIEEEDKILFQEAVLSAKAGALRTAYIALWLACAESIKRKFKEAGSYDSNAGKVVGEINQKETEKKSVDAFLLSKAKEYGFVSESEHDQLLAIYANRCIYGHPYEKGPISEQLQSEAALIVEFVLGRPTKLREGYFSKLADSILSDKHFLDDIETTVKEFAEIAISKTAPETHLWFLRKLWKKGFPMAQDPTAISFWHRVIWITQAFLANCPNDLWNGWQVTDDLARYPFLSLLMCSNEVFQKLDSHTKNYVVSKVLDDHKTTPYGVNHLMGLNKLGVLDERHMEKLKAAVDSTPLDVVIQMRVHPKTYAERVINGFKSHEWGLQNQSATALVAMGPQKMALLEPVTAEILGRNLLQSAEGSAFESKRFIEKLNKEKEKWSKSFISGIVFECFVNESNEFRIKACHCKNALLSLKCLTPDEGGEVVVALCNAIAQSTPKQDWDINRKRNAILSTIDEVVEMRITDFPDLSRLKAILESKDLPKDE